MDRERLSRGGHAWLRNCGVRLRGRAEAIISSNVNLHGDIAGEGNVTLSLHSFLGRVRLQRARKKRASSFGNVGVG